MKYNAIDLFSGCGGQSQGMKRAGFKVKIAVEKDRDAVLTYKMNHPNTCIIHRDIRQVETQEIKDILKDEPLHLLAGCPPCQGFSSVRRLNKKQSVRDERNQLILEYLRFVQGLTPFTIMMENVPGLTNYYLFNRVVKELKELGYHLEYGVVNIENYEVPQRRRRFVLVGSRFGSLTIAPEKRKKITVRNILGVLESIDSTNDPAHRTIAKRAERIKEIISLIPKDGGSRKDLERIYGDKYTLDCHKKEGVGFNDIYGRLKWDDYSSTITGGCLNPSKGRFLHPEEDREITAREAALLQTFPKNYKFPIAGFKLTKKSLVKLKKANLPDNILKKLERLEEQEYLDEKSFLKALKKTIGKDEINLYKTLILEYAEPFAISKASLSSLIGNALPPRFSFIQCKHIKEHLDKYLS